MKITLFDIKADLCAAWEEQFKDRADVSVFNGSLGSLPYHDFLVTAGNGFGAMSDSINSAVRNMVGYELQDYLQLEIMRLYPYGMPIGDTIIATLSDNFTAFRNIVYASTMRSLTTVRDLDIAFVMSAVTELALEHSDETFAIPGLGTGCGQLPAYSAAKAMRAGYDTAIFMKGV